jgi:hypothetical protein
MQIKLTPQHLNAEAVLKIKPNVIFKKGKIKDYFRDILLKYRVFLFIGTDLALKNFLKKYEKG